MQTRRRVGRILIVFGMCLVFAALGIFIYNEYESRRAESRSREEAERLKAEINERSKEQSRGSAEDKQDEGKNSESRDDIDETYIGIKSCDRRT